MTKEFPQNKNMVLRELILLISGEGVFGHFLRDFCKFVSSLAWKLDGKYCWVLTKLLAELD